MLHGGLVDLRARSPEDVAVLQRELHDDVPMRSRADSRPWRPVPPGSGFSPYAVHDPSEEVAVFSVIERTSSDLLGDAQLWRIDTHNRSAHIGIALIPAARQRGLGTDTVRVLCSYAFATLGLHRLQIDTLADNEAMLRIADRVGFVREGVHRHSAWVTGSFLDEVTCGLLSAEWSSTLAANAGNGE